MSTEQIIIQTKQLVAIPSTADNPDALKQALDFITALLERCPHVTIERFERNGKPSLLAYKGRKRPSRFSVLLNGHVDVVPGAAEQFIAVEKDGKLYGRGVLDMKGTTLVLTNVFCDTVNSVSYPLGLQIVTDEESSGHDGTKFQIEQGVRSEFVVMGEYANDRHTIYNAARGVCWPDITFRGKEAHGGHLWHGSNAILKAADFAQTVLKHYPIPAQETWTTTANVAKIDTANVTINKVPAEANLKIDFRFVQEDPVFASEESVRAFITNISPEAEINGFTVFEPAIYVAESNPYVQSLGAAIKAITGNTARFRGRPAASDGRHFAVVHNDSVEFGLYGKYSHSDREYVDISSFSEYRSILHQFLLDPDGVERTTLARQANAPKAVQTIQKLAAS